jgi:hypothetical protein
MLLTGSAEATEFCK